MQICIHRGTKEIGGSCVEVISNGQRLIMDLGLPLSAETNDSSFTISPWKLAGSCRWPESEI